MDVLSNFVVTFAVSVDQPLHRATRDVGDDAYHAVAADGEDGQRPAVVAAPHPEVVGLAGAYESDLVEVAARLLDAEDARQLGAAEHGGRGHVDRGAAL